jgi:hypothetical protein
MNVETDRARLIELERQRADALIRRDAAMLDALWPADLMHIHRPVRSWVRIS